MQPIYAVCFIDVGIGLLLLSRLKGGAKGNDRWMVRHEYSFQRLKRPLQRFFTHLLPLIG
jgi:hypothetical protein